MSKLDGNGLFESSRMIMPEHKAAMLKRDRERGKREKPVLDPQQWEDISFALNDSLRNHTKVTLTVFDPFEDKVYRGHVTVINTYLKEIKLREEDDWQWIKIDDILRAE